MLISKTLFPQVPYLVTMLPEESSAVDESTSVGRDGSACMRCLGTGWKVVDRRTGAQERCEHRSTYSPFDDPPEYHESFA